ncbi:MAG TPA: Do family serine endopeptidase [Bryobacteraceae bacterium]|nr:Do family serine endopeptidase [Bryobacteraceae bacterium]
MSEVLNRFRTQKLLSFTLIVFTLAIGIVIGTLINVNAGVKAAKDQTVAPGATPLVIPNEGEIQNAFTQIAKQVEPTVVNISTTYNPKPTHTLRRRQTTGPDDQDQDGDNDGNGGMDEFLYRFFGNPFGGGGGSPEMPQNHKGYALGSGVVVDRAGYILTNNHVVDKADRIQVKFANDPTEYEAKVIGVDAPTDLAVIRVEGKRDLTPAKIGNSDAVQVGDWAVAIGSPFGFDETMTAGIISAKGRDVDPTMQFQHFLQTDAAINPGNSGGPLLNIRGEVIGINTAIASRSGSNAGVGFALPINTAAEVYNAIIKNGHVTRGGIGVSFVPSDTDKARALLKANGQAQGVFVNSVVPGGPSDKAGIKEGDIIVGINGKPIRDGNQMLDIVANSPVGTALDVGAIRNGNRQSFKVVVGDLAQIFPEQFGSGGKEKGSAEEGGATSFGMQIQNLTDRQRQTLGLNVTGGVQVVSVEPDSFADDLGLKQGDIVVSINQHPVNSTDDLMRYKATLKPGDAVAMKVMTRQGRGGEWTSTYVAGTLPNHQ